MQVFKPEGGAPIKAWVDHVQFDDKAREQVERVARMPFIYSHVAVMPDVHWGLGATVGSVIATRGAVIPAAVGVDIGCGMMATKLYGLKASHLPDNLHAIRTAIEKAVPHGRTDNGGPNDRGAWGEIPAFLGNLRFQPLFKALEELVGRHAKLERAARRAPHQLATLGTGNHFIEICLDEDQSVWVMLHSGSRGIGNAIGQYFIEKAKEKMAQYFIDLPDSDLAYLPDSTPEFHQYVEAVEWAQGFAAENRRTMMEHVLQALKAELKRDPLCAVESTINCHHNYLAREHHFGQNVIVTRKGAVRAREGDLGLIPGSMGERSYVVRGKGNPQSFHSCSHGAGRRYSRGEAKRLFTLSDHIAATRAVECRKDEAVIDETPMAYKDIGGVMQAQQDLVEVLHTLRQIVNVKG